MSNYLIPIVIGILLISFIVFIISNAKVHSEQSLESKKKSEENWQIQANIHKHREALERDYQLKIRGLFDNNNPKYLR